MKQRPEERARAAIYRRVSTSMQAEKFSLPAQRRLLHEFASRKGWSVVEDYEDAGVSAETIEARPAFQRALEAARRGEYDVLLVIDLDRLSRSQDLRTWAEISETFRSAGVRVVTPNQTIDFEDEDDTFLAALLSLLAGREKAKLLRRSRRGMEEAVRSGRRMGTSRPPYGYRYDREAGHLVLHPEEAEIVKLIYELYLGGKSQSEIARELDRRGMPRRSGGPWWPNQIRSILTNPCNFGYTT